MKKYGVVLTLAAVCCLMGSAWAQFTQVTISDLQNGSISENTNVEITGVVSVASNNHVYVQESGSTRSGVRCYGGNGSTSGINIGDTVTIQGEYYEYYGETEVDWTVDGGSITWIPRGALPIRRSP
jgi:predicted extracellular nuclease